VTARRDPADNLSSLLFHAGRVRRLIKWFEMTTRAAPIAAAENPPDSPAEAAQERQQGPATAVKPRPAPAKPEQLPPYRVLLHNDDVNSMEYVVLTLQELTPLAHTRAVEVMLEADARGVALVLVTHKERAELYAEQFASKKMTVTIEPA